MEISLSSGSDQEFFELLEQARRGDLEALGRLINRCRPYLLKIANDEGDSCLQAKIGDSDLVQDACLDALHSFRQFRGRTSKEMFGWLRQILLNRLNGIREQFDAERHAIAADRPLPGGADDTRKFDLEAITTTPSEQVERKEEREVVERALRALPGPERTIIKMRQKEGRAFADIARQLHLTEEAARKRWVRAIQSLQNEVRRLYDQPAD